MVARPKSNVIVLGHWEQSWNAPLTEAPMWAWPLREYEVSEWWMHPVTGVRCPDQAVNLTEYEYMSEAWSALPEDYQPVFLEPNKPDAVTLPNFRHPEKAVYIFGSNHFDPTNAHRTDEPIVTIPTIENAGVLWTHQCLVTVLYDRLVKSWR